jgi:hypothetical protein
MTSKKLGTLLRSVPPATAQAPEPPEPPATARPPEESWPPPRRKVGPATSTPEVPLQVLVPKHIRIQLAVMAAEQGQSLRALVLTGIRSLGITVTDEEIRDKRGRRVT